MKEQLIQEVQRQMLPYLNNAQLKQLQGVLEGVLLVMLYCAIWIICFKKNSVFRALALSIIPSMLFLFSGIMSRSVLLIIASVLFAPSHIMISYKNVK